MSADEAEILGIYRNLMVEVHGRFDAIESLTVGATGLPARFAREACYLQLRMICESVALGSILAHEGFSDVSARKLAKAYAADQIINELTKLHDRFFPRPIAIRPRSETHFAASDRDIEHLSKENLIEVYRKCGSVLHRGTPAMFRSGEKIEDNWVDYIDGTTQHAINLLSHHAVVMRGEKRAIFCSLFEGRVWAAKAV